MSLESLGLTAIIPVRQGSRRMPGKNLSDFNGVSLLQHKISVLKGFLNSDQIVVSSNSPEMLEVAQINGVRGHWRPDEFSDDVEGKTLGETIAHIASGVSGETILWAQATSPLVSEDSYKSAIEQYERDIVAGFDSLISVNRVSEYFRNEAGPVNYQTGRGHTPSQQLPPFWRVTYGVIIAKRQNMVDWEYYYGEKPSLFELNKIEAIDIDDEIDFRVAEFLASWTQLDGDNL